MRPYFACTWTYTARCLPGVDGETVIGFLSLMISLGSLLYTSSVGSWRSFAIFKRYKAWAENVTGRKLQILHDNKGSEYSSMEFNCYLADAGIHWEHSIHDTPQQLGVAE